MIFTLPNGLQGYYLANGKGERIDSAPTAIVTDKNASDQTVRNGLSCMRCHERGMLTFTDVVRPTLQKLGNASEREQVSLHAALIAGLATGALCPVIGQELPLAEAAKAHHAVIETRAYGKIVLIP